MFEEPLEVLVDDAAIEGLLGGLGGGVVDVVVDHAALGAGVGGVELADGDVDYGSELG